MNTEQKFIREPEKMLPVRKEVDVLVVGGGPSGITSAMAAAEDGLKVTLLESRSFVGGNMTIGLPILGFLGQTTRIRTIYTIHTGHIHPNFPLAQTRN